MIKERSHDLRSQAGAVKLHSCCLHLVACREGQGSGHQQQQQQQQQKQRQQQEEQEEEQEEVAYLKINK